MSGSATGLNRPDVPVTGLIERRGKMVSFCWVPAHVGVVGNELADNLAKQAAHSNRPGIKPVPYEDHVHVIKQFVKSCWQFHWDLETSNKLKKLLQVPGVAGSSDSLFQKTPPVRST